MKRRDQNRFFLYSCALAAIVLSGILNPQNLEAQRRPLRLVSTPESITGGYDARQETVVPAEFTVDGFGTDFLYRISAGGSGDAGNRSMTGPAGRLLGYVLRNLDGEIADASIPGRIAGNSGPVTVPFEMAVPAGQVVPAGSYQDTVTLTLLDSDGVFVEERVILVTVSMPQVVALSVVDPGGEFDPSGGNASLDFGVLIPGSQQTGNLDLVVRTNSNYAVRIQSMNFGVLAMTSLSDGSAISYVLEIDGVPRDLSGGTAEVAQGFGPTTEAGDRYQLHFTVGPVGPVTSGDYEDNLTVIVTAQ